ncbi:avidin/streptavidin family protein [Actinokineospora auranticolor]|uniref:Avidin family protein n=1 Tax=Actinokineospora auranticolor TaxID=155976 RepID=A0A2S6GJW5_9PSEU|nr:avidin/streptavidin family protein [Actinokineospora auranticolor]PPK65480.1 avidin family protein [Actinokineospora auranticolor]
MSVNGVWYNELNSKMTIATASDGVTLTGTYQSLVGNAPGVYALVGKYNAAPTAGYGAAVGWSVSWQNGVNDSNSLTTWSGQYFAVGREWISTTWLMVVQSTVKSVWESTMVAVDKFYRQPATDEEVEARLALGHASSHPLDVLGPRG